MNFDNHHPRSFLQGALNLEPIGTKPVFFGEQIRTLETEKENRIFEIAVDCKSQLPESPDSKAVESFQTRQKATALLRFPNSSLADIKRLGSGEYVAEHSNEKVSGNFGFEVHCPKKEDAANEVEQQVDKSAAVILLETGIGEKFNSIDTGSSGKETRVRLLDMPVEEKLDEGLIGVDVGDQIRVELIQINVKREFIDF